MTTAYTSLLGLALPVTGELSGTWGDTVNTAITSLLDTAVAGTTSITTDADITLTTTTGASNQARQAIILWNPASGTTTRYITAPAQSKLYTVINASGGTQSIVIRGVGPTTGVTIAKGESAMVAWNGSDFVKVSSSGGALTLTDLTVTGNTILGDAAADTLTVNATSTFASPVNFQGLVKLPSTGRSAASALTTTNPAFLYGVASTYTDTTSSGTVAFAPFYLLAQPTLSTSNVTTYTNAATLYIANAPATAGSATITNPYALYVAAGISAFGGAAFFANNVTLGDASADTITVNGTITSNLLFTDNTYDIGASGATRPRNLYLAGNEVVAGSVTWSGGTAYGVPYLNASKVVSTGTALSFDGTQQFGVGSRNTSWKTSYSVVQVGNSAIATAGTYTYFMNNAYIDSSDTSTYQTTGAATQYALNRNDGAHYWYGAGSGSAGAAITAFASPKMKLDVNGYLMLNTTSAQAAISVGNVGHSNLIATGVSSWSQNLVLGTGYAVGPEDYTQLRVPGNAANSAQLLLTSANRLYVGDGYNTGDGQLNVNKNGASAVPMLTFNNRTTGTSSYITGSLAFQGYRDVRDPAYIGLIDVVRYQLSGGLNSQGHMRFFAGAEGRTYAEIVAQTANIYIDGYNGAVGVNTNSPASFSRFVVIGGTNANQGTVYFGDGSSRSLNLLTNTTGGAYNSLTGAGDVLLYGGGQYQPMTVGIHDGGAIRFTQSNTYIGAGSGGTLTTWSNGIGQSTLGYVEAKGNDSAIVFQSNNTSANALQYYVQHTGAAVLIGNARANNFSIKSGSNGANELLLQQDTVRIYDNTYGTRASIKTEVFTITSGTGGTTVNLSTTANYTGLIAVFGSGNDTSAAIFYVAGASEYDYETIGTLVSSGFGVGYTGSTSISIGSSLGNPLTMTVTSAGGTTTRTYVVYYLGGI